MDFHFNSEFSIIASYLHGIQIDSEIQKDQGDQISNFKESKNVQSSRFETGINFIDEQIFKVLYIKQKDSWDSNKKEQLHSKISKTNLLSTILSPERNIESLHNHIEINENVNLVSDSSISTNTTNSSYKEYIKTDSSFSTLQSTNSLNEQNPGIQPLLIELFGVSGSGKTLCLMETCFRTLFPKKLVLDTTQSFNQAFSPPDILDPTSSISKHQNNEKTHTNQIPLNTNKKENSSAYTNIIVHIDNNKVEFMNIPDGKENVRLCSKNTIFFVDYNGKTSYKSLRIYFQERIITILSNLLMNYITRELNENNNLMNPTPNSIKNIILLHPENMPSLISTLANIPKFYEKHKTNTQSQQNPIPDVLDKQSTVQNTPLLIIDDIGASSLVDKLSSHYLNRTSQGSTIFYKMQQTLLNTLLDLLKYMNINIFVTNSPHIHSQNVDKETFYNKQKYKAENQLIENKIDPFNTHTKQVTNNQTEENGDSGIILHKDTNSIIVNNRIYSNHMNPGWKKMVDISIIIEQ
ncbi:hypothetical protein BB558_001053 [Smittium angustum]|uniref:Uncharacterized protein n=1 Tax=Smittium angustum TaxID=133377 RepID=A0A2U1JCR3_SMIAN|nr:hypothetical protein BB558_001053 [Smittium angustum]